MNPSGQGLAGAEKMGLSRKQFYNIFQIFENFAGQIPYEVVSQIIVE
jgi:hypothetical protein